MLELSAGLAIALLVAREFLVIAPGARSQRAARIAGLSALPFLLIFAIAFAVRALSFLGAAA